MDPAVLAALARWPGVPHVFGWLRLDRRGCWRLRDEPIAHPGLIDFIARNYGSDASGRWYFQNGPQRVYVQLDYTPWILHRADGMWLRQDGRPPPAPEEALLDEDGALLIAGGDAVGLVDDRDLAHGIDRLTGRDGLPLTEAALDALAAGSATDAWLGVGGDRIPLRRVRADDLPERFGYVPTPHPDTD